MLHILSCRLLLILHGVRLNKTSIMALPGLKPPAQLNLEDNIAIKWRAWLHAYKLYATAAGVITESEKYSVQCFNMRLVQIPKWLHAHSTLNQPRGTRSIHLSMPSGITVKVKTI